MQEIMQELRQGAREEAMQEKLSLMEMETSLAEPRVDGLAYGLDYVGNFKHHTGNLGPFGFYANFYDEK